MAYRIAPFSMPLNNLRGQFCFFNFHKVTLHVTWSLCWSWASCSDMVGKFTATVIVRFIMR